MSTLSRHDRVAERRIVRDGDLERPRTWDVRRQGVTFADDRSIGERAGDVNDGPTREWARLRQGRDCGRKVTGVRNDEGAGDGLAECRRRTRTVLVRRRAGAWIWHLGLRSIRYDKRAGPGNERERRTRVAGTAMRWSSIPPFFTGSASCREFNVLSARAYLTLQRLRFKSLNCESYTKRIGCHQFVDGNEVTPELRLGRQPGARDIVASSPGLGSAHPRLAAHFDVWFASVPGPPEGLEP